MQSDLEQRIKSERAAITALDSTLDSNRTPYMKRQLRLAGHMLDDADAGLRHAEKSDQTMWLGFAEMNLHLAAQIRVRVQAAVDKFGGPEHVIEIGG